jgi:hypothetical protein
VALVKRRQYGDIVSTNKSTFVGTSVSPIPIARYAAPHSVTDTFLRGRFDLNVCVQVDPVDAPPFAWFGVTNFLLIAYWNTSGTTVVGPSFGTSEHFLGSQLLKPTLSSEPGAVAGSYVVQFNSDDPLIVQTPRKGDTASSPRVNLGLTAYDPYAALDGTYTSIAVNYQAHNFVLWGSPT